MGQMTKVAQWVRNIVEREFGGHLEVGMVTTNPETGKAVRITDGQYWGEHGLSNFWYWREVLPDGSLSEVEGHGYGWQPK